MASRVYRLIIEQNPICRGNWNVGMMGGISVLSGTAGLYNIVAILLLHGRQPQSLSVKLDSINIFIINSIQEGKYATHVVDNYLA